MAHDDSKDFASKGVAGSALGLGIAGTALALLNNTNGGLGGLFGGNPVPHSNGYHNSIATGFEVGYVIDNERRIGRLEAKTEGIEVAVVKDKEINELKTQLVQSNLLRYVDDKTCGTIKGQTLLNPNQIGDPYMGQRMVIATHPPVVEFDRFRGGCNDHRHDHDRWY